MKGKSTDFPTNNLISHAQSQSSTVDRVVEGLAAVLLSLKRRPIIRHQRK